MRLKRESSGRDVASITRFLDLRRPKAQRYATMEDCLDGAVVQRMNASCKADDNTSLQSMEPDITYLTPIGDEIEERPQKPIARILLGLSENSKKDRRTFMSFYSTPSNRSLRELNLSWRSRKPRHTKVAIDFL